MVSDKFARTLIVGNGGSGKSWLAERLADRLSIPAFDLDLIHWEPGGFNKARDREIARKMVHDLAVDNEAWIIEGVYGWLAVEAFHRATALIWLLIDDAECIENTRNRGIRRGGTEESQSALLTWIGEYRERQNANSFLAHSKLFDAFKGFKIKLQSRTEIETFLGTHLAAG